MAKKSSAAPKKSRAAKKPSAPVAAPTREDVSYILDQIRPSLQFDGGDCELVNITPEGRVEVRLVGACVGCPMSAMTLKWGIEKTLKEHVPGVTEVVNLAEVSEE